MVPGGPGPGLVPGLGRRGAEHRRTPDRARRSERAEFHRKGPDLLSSREGPASDLAKLRTPRPGDQRSVMRNRKRMAAVMIARLCGLGAAANRVDAAAPGLRPAIAYD